MQESIQGFSSRMLPMMGPSNSVRPVAVPGLANPECCVEMYEAQPPPLAPPHHAFPMDSVCHAETANRFSEWTTNCAISQVLMTMGDNVYSYPSSNCSQNNGRPHAENFSLYSNINFDSYAQQPQIERLGHFLLPLGEPENTGTAPSSRLTNDKQYESSVSTSASMKNETLTPQREKKGRNKTSHQTYAERKKCSNTNQRYINSKGMEVLPRIFDLSFDCACSKKCTEKVSVEDRRSFFKKYWDCGSFEARSAIINYCVEEENVARHYSKNVVRRRTKTRRYTICGVEVCQKAFLKTLQINESRVGTCLKKVKDPTASICDQRGKHKKALEDRYRSVVGHINSLARGATQGRKRKNCPKFQDSDLECCSRKCLEKVSCEDRKNLFTKYWECRTFEARSAVIIYCVKEEAVHRHYSKCGSRRRTKTRHYSIAETEVCQKAFLKTLQINESRVATCLRKMKDPSASVSDQRGNKGSQLSQHCEQKSSQDDQSRFSESVYESVFNHVNSLSSRIEEREGEPCRQNIPVLENEAMEGVVSRAYSHHLHQPEWEAVTTKQNVCLQDQSLLVQSF